MTDADRDAYLTGLTPGANIDHQGTTFTGTLLFSLLHALRDPETGKARLGNAKFNSATFKERAWFTSAIFKGDAGFDSAIFKGGDWFGSASLEGGAWFDSATFKGDASFGSRPS
ncbi:pentapeptide repeat-containing protein [Streptomyces anulatus]|uniref:pentapeptide repeat-containing protein n=1 Tax=Streptomyces anulatus TaxID=1892 RepID=UPI0036C20254